MSEQAASDLSKAPPKGPDENMDPFDDDGVPEFPVGQIIFDINGEYANPNMQDEGTAIYEIYTKHVTRYSVLDKPGFKVLKVNFYRDLISGFEPDQEPFGPPRRRLREEFSVRRPLGA